MPKSSWCAGVWHCPSSFLSLRTQTSSLPLSGALPGAAACRRCQHWGWRRRLPLPELLVAVACSLRRRSRAERVARRRLGARGAHPQNRREALRQKPPKTAARVTSEARRRSTMRSSGATKITRLSSPRHASPALSHSGTRDRDRPLGRRLSHLGILASPFASRPSGWARVRAAMATAKKKSAKKASTRAPARRTALEKPRRDRRASPPSEGRARRADWRACCPGRAGRGRRRRRHRQLPRPARRPSAHVRGAPDRSRRADAVPARPLRDAPQAPRRRDRQDQALPRSDRRGDRASRGVLDAEREAQARGDAASRREGRSPRCSSRTARSPGRSSR